MLGRHPLISARLKAAILATWLVLYALGSAGLHSILECGHDEAAETFAHQETATAHWAGLKSAPAPTAECPACTLVGQVGYLPEGVVTVFHSAAGEQVTNGQTLFIPLRLREQAQPRAPPVA